MPAQLPEMPVDLLSQIERRILYMRGGLARPGSRSISQYSAQSDNRHALTT